MFNVAEKQWLAGEVEKLLLSLNHPEMPKERPLFRLYVDGVAGWSWANIGPNWAHAEEPPALPEQPRDDYEAHQMGLDH